MTTRRILTWAVTIYGLLMFVHPSGWRTDLFHLAFSYLPARAWGALFLIAGVLKLTHTTWWTRSLVAAVMWGWGACLLGSVLGDLVHHRQPTSLAGWVWPVSIGVAVAIGDDEPRELAP